MTRDLKEIKEGTIADEGREVMGKMSGDLKGQQDGGNSLQGWGMGL